jgi:hypothetical protein
MVQRFSLWSAFALPHNVGQLPNPLVDRFLVVAQHELSSYVVFVVCPNAASRVGANRAWSLSINRSKRGDARELATFQPFEECPARGRDIGQVFGNAGGV